MLLRPSMQTIQIVDVLYLHIHRTHEHYGLAAAGATVMLAVYSCADEVTVMHKFGHC